MTSLRLPPVLRTLLVALVICAFSVESFRILLEAYPITSHGFVPGNNYTIDFGAYYNAGLKLVHDPAQLYNSSAYGGYNFGVTPVSFKYLPFFSFFVIPFLALNFTSAAVAWDVFQFLLLPLMGFLLFRALKSFNVIIIIGVIWVALIQPVPFPPHYTLSFYDLYHSQSFYWQWAEGNAKVLETFLVVAGYYFSKVRRPYWAGLFYGLSFFDPRFGLMAIPLLLVVNLGQYKRFVTSTVLTLLAGDAILLFYGLGGPFITMVQTTGIETSLFQYTWIPIYTIAAITLVEGTNFVYRRVRVTPESRQAPGNLT